MQKRSSVRLINGVGGASRLLYSLRLARTSCEHARSLATQFVSGFAFFLGEYANMVLMSSLTTILFLGGWLAPFPLNIEFLNVYQDLFGLVLKYIFLVFYL